ncbi:MAG: hypothetical protein K2J80_03985 [Oscillospiraceae bacterium]|nr:hypothetical protein [Oscillospiraceae bacterium]
MSKISSFIRSIIMAALVIVASFFCGIRLLQTQLVDGEKYLSMTKSVKVTTQEIESARGQIVDTNGKVLNTNKISHNLNLQYSSLEKGKENEIIYRVVTVMLKNGDKWNDSLPITTDAPYKFLTGKGKDSEIAKLKKVINVAGYASAEDCMYWLYRTFEIDDQKYDEKMRRYIAGVRYEMALKEFSEYNNKFVLASDICMDTVSELKELDYMLEGVDISDNWERIYLDPTLAPHLRGVVGAISEDQYDKLKDQGYKADDIIGREGIEKALEEELHGTRGERTITRSSEVAGIKEEITKEPSAGKSVMLTLDSELQQLMQDALKYHIDYINSDYLTPAINYTQYKKGCKAGSIVVLDVKTGGVLAAASYPGYDINDMIKNYTEVLNRPDNPLLNRALFGEYRPGSTFKTITGTAGMAEGAITPTSTISCGHNYPYYGGRFTCLGWHGGIPVTEGLRYSCNIFFYETARRIGIDKLAYWGAKFGIGEDLGFELDMSTGHMSSLEYFEEMGYDWYEGNIIQAGIGQCETAVTPMHLAVQAMTIANKGVRYEPHIVKSVYNYDLTEKLYDKERVIAEDFSDYPDMDKYMDAIKTGMQYMADTQVSFSINGRFVNTFAYLGFKGQVATKSGTPQTSENEYNSALVGFYPAAAPEIAFGILLENGEYSKVLAANVVNAYVHRELSTQYDENGVPKSIL